MTSPVSLPAGHIVVAEDFDAYENLTSTWTDYSSSLSWTSTGTAPSLGNAVVSAKYIRVGKRVEFHGKVTFGSSSGFGSGTYRMSVPVAASSTEPWIGSCITSDDSVTAAKTGGACVFSSSTMLAFYSTGGIVTSTVPFTWAQNDVLQWSIVYQAA